MQSDTETNCSQSQFTKLLSRHDKRTTTLSTFLVYKICVNIFELLFHLTLKISLSLLKLLNVFQTAYKTLVECVNFVSINSDLPLSQNLILKRIVNVSGACFPEGLITCRHPLLHYTLLSDDSLFY